MPYMHLRLRTVPIGVLMYRISSLTARWQAGRLRYWRMRGPGYGQQIVVVVSMRSKSSFTYLDHRSFVTRCLRYMQPPGHPSPRTPWTMQSDALRANAINARRHVAPPRAHPMSERSLSSDVADRVSGMPIGRNASAGLHGSGLGPRLVPASPGSLGVFRSPCSGITGIDRVRLIFSPARRTSLSLRRAVGFAQLGRP